MEWTLTWRALDVCVRAEPKRRIPWDECMNHSITACGAVHPQKGNEIIFAAQQHSREILSYEVI